MNTRRFREILEAHVYLPINEQKSEIERYLKKWHSDLEQVGDILEIGVRL
jgi:hypothetical protein